MKNTADRKPNLIYVFADQLRYQSLGYTGDMKADTPNIDALCSKSVNLCNAVSGHPVCAPYRASLLTGKYTTSTGMVINEIKMNPNHRSFAHVLNDSGYETSYIGKWHMYASELGNHYDPKNSYIPKGPDRLGFDSYFAAYNFHHDFYGERAYYHLDSPEKLCYHDKYEPDAQTDMAIAQLKQLSDSEKPFALFLSLGTPHDPWTPSNVPKEYLEKFRDTEFALPPNYLPDNDPHADAWACLNKSERTELTEWMRVYYAMTANLDDNIGRLTAEIDKLNLSDSSIIVFTSDHGELFGAHGRRAKNIFYDEAVRVPFLLRWDNVTKPGSICDVCLNTVDIMPTLLSLMNLSVPLEAEGEDLSRCIIKNEPYDEGSLMMCTGPTAIFGDGNEWRAYRTKRYTYAIFRSDKSEFLFDNITDPYQMNNLAGSPEYLSVKKELSEKMYSKMNSIGDTFEANSYYKNNWIENRVIMRTATLN